MSYLLNGRAEDERHRWTCENAHLHIRPDAERFIRHDEYRFLRPDSPGWVHPDAKLFDPFFRHLTYSAGPSGCIRNV